MEPVTDWRGGAGRVADVGRLLRVSGVPVDLIALFRRTLHPEILGRATLWAPNRPVEIFDRDHGLDLSGGFCRSPLDRAISENIACVLAGMELERASWAWGDPLRGLGLHEMLIRPLRPDAALVIGTRRSTGFDPSDLGVVERLTKGRRTGPKRKKPVSQ